MSDTTRKYVIPALAGVLFGMLGAPGWFVMAVVVAVYWTQTH